MVDYDNTPPVAKALSGMTPDNTAPVAKALSFTPDNAAPTAIAINQAQDNTPPVAKTLTGMTPDETAPVAVDLTTPKTPNNAAAVPIGTPPAPLITMPSTFVPAFVELTGGGNCLDSLSATAADIGKILTGKVGGRLKNYEVCAGTDATDSPGIIRAANYVDPDNAIVFVQR